MLADLRAYDECLESFSRPLLERTQYELDDEGRMTVTSENTDLYRYVDFTRMAEYLYSCIAQAIRKDFAEELRFLAGFDTAKRAVDAIVDLPDRLVSLFIRLCASNGWKLPKVKRDAHFSMLTEDEIVRLENAVSEAFEPSSPTPAK
jgi:hypothetical protein